MMLIESNNDARSEAVILAITIIAKPGRFEVETIIDHTPEETRNADGETRTVTCRKFPRHVACPVAAAQQLAMGARLAHPHAIVTLVNA